MLISEYLQTRNASITAGSHLSETQTPITKNFKPQNSPFAAELLSQIEKNNSGNNKQQVEFSRHAMDRMTDRNIDLNEGNKLERLNKAIEVAQQKGSVETLVLLDSIAFLVSVKNNKVITTLSADDLQGNIFTNIDSTVIM